MILPTPNIEGQYTILVTGGRNYADTETFNIVLCYIYSKIQFTKIVHGGAQGADTLADLLGHCTNVPRSVYEADWKKYGKAAGMIRNREMLDKNEDLDLVVAFPGGKGTAGMIKLSKERNIPVIIIVDSRTYYDTDNSWKQLNDIPNNL